MLSLLFFSITLDANFLSFLFHSHAHVHFSNFYLYSSDKKGTANGTDKNEDSTKSGSGGGDGSAKTSSGGSTSSANGSGEQVQR